MPRSLDEALRLGIKTFPVVHKGTRRAFWHRYNGKGEYGITIHINTAVDGSVDQCLLLGRIEGDTRLMPSIDSCLAHPEDELPQVLHFVEGHLPRFSLHAAMENLIPASRRALAASLCPPILGREPSVPPHIVLSPLGRLVEQKIKEIGTHRYEENVRAAYYVILPTHIHIVLSVGEDLPMHTVRGKAVPIVVGNIMRGFEAGVTSLFFRLLDGETVEEIIAHPDAGRKSHDRPTILGVDGRRYPAPTVWSPDGFNDRVLINEEKFLAWLRYLALNPYYWKLRQDHPDLFTHVLHITIANVDYSAYGCMFLLRRPERRQVYCHRFKMNADGSRYVDPVNHSNVPYTETEEFRRQKAALLRACEDDGAVLISPAVSLGEQDIIRSALEAGFPVIKLQKEPIDAGSHALDRDRDYCARGQMLVLGPWQIIARPRTDSHGSSIPASSLYAKFHNLNDMAADLCREGKDMFLMRSPAPGHH